MTFARPWALAGLAFLALPILIHMMGRGRARVLNFPSLRFLDTSRLLPARRTRIHDVVLLVLRCLAIAGAAFALAGPVWGPRSAASVEPDEVNHLILVDTSASMARTTPSGATALSAARRFADSVKASGPLNTVIETAQPALALAGASAWLATLRGAGEIDVISDFQLGAIDSVAIASVPAQIGLRFMRVPLGVLARPGPPAPIVRPALIDVVPVLAGSADRAGADAAQTAAREVGRLAPAAVNAPKPIILVHARAERRAALLGSAARLTEAGDVALVARIIADSLLAQAALEAEPVARPGANGAGARNSVPALPVGAVVVARNRSGQPVAFAAQVTDGGAPRVALFALVEAASPSVVALHIAAARAVAAVPAAAEFETEVLTDAVLAGWQRAPGAAPAPATTEASENNPLDTVARWLWIAALALLAIETWARTSVRFANTIRPAGAPGGTHG